MSAAVDSGFMSVAEIAGAILSQMDCTFPSGSMLDKDDDNALGNMALLDRGTSPSSATVSLFRAQAPCARNTHVATIFASLRGEVVDGNGRAANIVLRVSGGSGSGPFDIEADVGEGTQISIPAATLQVSVGIEAMPLADAANFREATVSVGVAWGSRPGQGGATRTLPPVVIAPGASVVFRPPPFAYAVNLLSANRDFYAAGGGNVRFLGSPNTLAALLAEFDSSACLDALGGDGLRFGGLVRGVEVENLTAAVSRISPVFALNL